MRHGAALEAAAQLELPLRGSWATSPGRPVPSRDGDTPAGTLPVAATCAPARPTGSDLLAVLRTHGLRGISNCCLTSNRSVMVSHRGTELRVQRAFASAPEEVLRAIVAFVHGRGLERRRARRTILTFPVPDRGGPRRRAHTHAADASLAARLTSAHRQLNAERFGGALRSIRVRVSRRLSARLGLFRLPSGSEGESEIVISRRHIRRDGWRRALDTLLHEMVHQWQHESGRRVDHAAEFHAKARALGLPRQTR